MTKQESALYSRARQLAVNYVYAYTSTSAFIAANTGNFMHQIESLPQKQKDYAKIFIEQSLLENEGAIDGVTYFLKEK